VLDPLMYVSVPVTVPVFVGANTTFTFTLCPALIVSGKETPGIEYCELLLDPDETVTLPPVAVSVAGCVDELPTSTLPKLSVAGLTPSWPLVVLVPVPLSGMFTLGPETNTLPPTSPADFGANATVSETLWPELRTTGKVAPLTEYPLPVVWIPLRVTFQVAEFFRTNESLLVEPTATCPNERLAGLGVIDSELTPFPPTDSRRVGVDELLVNVTVAPAQPLFVGAKSTFTLTVWPAPTVAGRFKPDTPNTDALAVIAVIETLAVPVLVRVTTSVSFCPIITSPNFRVDGDNCSDDVAAIAPERANAINVIIEIK
jgi:hypothetical protein